MSDQPRGMYELRVERPEKASQTLLNKISDCPYGGALYLKHRGGAQSHAMARGEAIHRAIELCTNMAIANEERDVPPEVAKEYAQAVLDERTDLAMPPKEHDACRVALWNWARWAAFDPSTHIGCEIMLELEIAGWTIRGKIDRAEIADGDGYVYDYKTGLSLPTQEEHEDDFQQQFYGLLLLEGVPEGETVPLGRGLSGVHLNAVFPRIISNDTGLPYVRHAYKDRAQIHDFRRTVEAALAKLDDGLATGLWKASPGGHCSECPAQAECPIPAIERPSAVATEGQAAEVAERLIVIDNERAGLQKALKTYLSEHGPVEVGGVRFSLEPQEAEKLRDKAALKAALENAGLNPQDFFVTQTSTRFSKRKVKA